MSPMTYGGTSASEFVVREMRLLMQQPKLKPLSSASFFGQLEPAKVKPLSPLNVPMLGVPSPRISLEDKMGSVFLSGCIELVSSQMGLLIVRSTESFCRVEVGRISPRK